jgi:hypothetical protein
LAIYHFAVSVISRARGQRIVAVAAACAAAKLRDAYYGLLHNQQRREGVEFAEIAAPAESPSWVFDREQLWNRVETAEHRKDSQLARAIEISLPVELGLEQCISLLREYVHAEFVSKRMIADMSIRRTKLGNPNARVLLTLREASAMGFGPKMRQWNRKNNLMDWRASWANCANLHLARAGQHVRIDHRTLDAQQIVLTPARRTGIGLAPGQLEELPGHLQARFEQQRRIAGDNGSVILEDPAIAIRALAHQRRRFTRADLHRFLVSRTDGEAQLNAALSATMACSELVPLDAAGTVYTSRDLMEAEKALLRRAQNMTKRGEFQAVAVLRGELDDFLQTAHSYWNERGKQVRNAMPRAEDALTRHDVVLLQGAEMIDLKALEKHLDAAERARATLVLVADAERLQAMGAMSPMHGLIAPATANT